MRVVSEPAFKLFFWKENLKQKKAEESLARRIDAAFLLDLGISAKHYLYLSAKALSERAL